MIVELDNLSGHTHTVVLAIMVYLSLMAPSSKLSAFEDLFLYQRNVMKRRQTNGVE